MLTDEDKVVLIAFAESGMNKSKTAEKAFMHRHNVTYHLERVKKETGLDPYNLFQLAQLVGLAEIGSEELLDNTQYLFDRQQAEMTQLKNQIGELQDERILLKSQLCKEKNKTSKLRNERNRQKKELERYKTALVNANKSYRKLWEETHGVCLGNEVQQ
jgi:septal ring factor EnvC (AmiA/AmiB activator)